MNSKSISKEVIPIVGLNFSPGLELTHFQVEQPDPCDL